ncbi:MAG: thiamine biosynthesis protein ThiC, partial [Deltaproteobacteria bacterium]|nr:thiamine biosynthesis protein ThiC [Deltaproteobacteria bacterium]
GVRAAKVAVYIGDMVKYGRRERDKEISKARRDLDWEKQFDLALYGDTARAIRDSRQPAEEKSCTMCGSFCAAKESSNLFQDVLDKSPKK